MSNSNWKGEDIIRNVRRDPYQHRGFNLKVKPLKKERARQLNRQFLVVSPIDLRGNEELSLCQGCRRPIFNNKTHCGECEWAASRPERLARRTEKRRTENGR
jgi:hypothetical protein